MSLIRTTILFFICLSVFANGIVNAAASCCTNNDNIAIEIQMDSEGEQPCHDMAKTGDQNTMECHGCDCQHCVNITVLPPHIDLKEGHTVCIKSFGNQTLYSRTLENPFHPPKQTS